MKKLLVVLLALLMLVSVAACGKNSDEPAAENTTETQEAETTELVIEGDPAEYSMDYWAEKFPGENICPFSIEENGKEHSYYWVSSFEGWDGTIIAWIKQPFNWNGWHMTEDGCIVNKDETFKITDNWVNGEGMSSNCVVTTEKYNNGKAEDTTAAEADNTEPATEIEKLFVPVSSAPASDKVIVNIAADVKFDDETGWLGLCPAGKDYITEAEADDADVIWFGFDAHDEGTPYVFNCDFSSVEDGNYAVVLTSSDDESVGYVILQLGLTKNGNSVTFDYSDAKINERP